MYTKTLKYEPICRQFYDIIRRIVILFHKSCLLCRFISSVLKRNNEIGLSKDQNPIETKVRVCCRFTIVVQHRSDTNVETTVSLATNRCHLPHMTYGQFFGSNTDCVESCKRSASCSYFFHISMKSISIQFQICFLRNWLFET